MDVKKLLSSAFLCGGLITSFASFAEGPHDDQIKARQAMFQLYAYHSGLLGDMAKGDVEYDAEIALEAAKNLEAASKLGQSTFWPQGSDNSNSENARTRALPEIWESFPDILEKVDGLQKAATALAAVAGDGVDALKAGMGDVGQACKACHQEFRAKKK